MTQETPTGFERPEIAAHHAHLLDAHLRVAESYPKTIMLLSGGSLTLSLSFIDKLVGEPGPVFLRSLHLGWILLVISLSTIAAAMLLSLGLLERVTDNYPQFLAGTYTLAAWRPRLLKVLNIAAAVTLVLGLLALVLFAAENF